MTKYALSTAVSLFTLMAIVYVPLTTWFQKEWLSRGLLVICERQQDAIVVMIIRLYPELLTPDWERSNAVVKQILTKKNQRPEPPTVMFYNQRMFEPVSKNWNEKPSSIPI